MPALIASYSAYSLALVVSFSQAHSKIEDIVMEIINFIISYFVTKNMYLLSAFVCWPPERVVQLWRSASEAGVRLTVYCDPRQPPRFPKDVVFREGFLVDLQCPGVEYLLQNASSTRAFNYRNSWLLMHNSSHDREVIADTLEDYDVLPDADVVWSSPDGLIDVYRAKAKHSYFLINLGLGRNSSSQELLSLWGSLPSTVSRRKDLKNVTLAAGVVLSQPAHFRGWTDMNNRQIDTYPKVTYPLMQLVAQDLNFHYNMRQVNLYGVVDANGSFDGLAGLLQRHTVEVGIASIFMRSDRMEALHYFTETVELSCAFIFRQPSRSAVSNVFLAPFSSGVWSACAVVCGAGAALLGMLRSAAARRLPQRQRHQLEPLTLQDTLTFVLGSMCQQGFHITPSVTSVRVVMFSTLMASLFVFTAYSAKIVSLLQTPSDAMRTLDDLTRSPMTLGVQETTYKKVYFTESADASAQQLYRRKILPQGERAYMSVVDGIARVRTGLFAFQVERSAGYDVVTRTFTEREKCALDEIEAFKMPRVSIPIRRYSGYRELFAVRLRWQRETGLMDRERRVWLAARPRCASSSGDFVSIGITDVLPALQALALGALLAVLLLGTEVGAHALKHRRTERSPRARTNTKRLRLARRKH